MRMGWLPVVLMSVAVGAISLLAAHGALHHLLRAIAVLTLVVALIGKLLGWTRWAELAIVFPIAAIGATMSAVLVWSFLGRKK